MNFIQSTPFGPLAAGVLAISSSVAVAAPGGNDYFPTALMTEIAFPTSAGVSGARTVVAELDGDARPDVVVLHQGRLAVFYGAGIYESTGSAGSLYGAEAMATVKLSDHETRDGIVTTGNGGFLLWKFDDTGRGLSSTAIALTGWSNVRRLVSGSIDNGGTADDLVGIDVDGKTVLVAADVTSTPSAYPSYTGTENVFDVCFADVQVDSSAKKEVVMLRSQSVEILTATGTLTDVPSATIVSGFATVLDSPITGQRVALAGLPSGGTQYYLHLLDGTTLGTPIGLGTDDLVSLNAGYVNVDDEADLVFAESDGVGPTVMLQDDSSLGFSAPVAARDQVVINADSATAAEAVLWDLDNDGGEELIYPARFSGVDRLLVIDWVSTVAPSVVPVPPFSIQSQMLRVSDVNTIFNSELGIQMPSAANGMPDLELTVWRKTWGATGISNQATRHELVGISNFNGPQLLRFSLDETLNGTFPTVDWNGTPVGHDPNYALPGDVFVFEVRQVQRNGTLVKKAGPSHFYAHLSLTMDVQYTGGFLDTYYSAYPSLPTDFTLTAMDTAATATANEMATLRAENGGEFSTVREFDPGDVPLPKPPPLTGGAPNIPPTLPSQPNG